MINRLLTFSVCVCVCVCVCACVSHLTDGGPDPAPLDSPITSEPVSLINPMDLEMGMYVCL